MNTWIKWFPSHLPMTTLPSSFMLPLQQQFFFPPPQPFSLPPIQLNPSPLPSPVSPSQLNPNINIPAHLRWISLSYNELFNYIPLYPIPTVRSLFGNQNVSLKLNRQICEIFSVTVHDLLFPYQKYQFFIFDIIYHSSKLFPIQFIILALHYFMRLNQKFGHCIIEEFKITKQDFPLFYLALVSLASTYLTDDYVKWTRIIKNLYPELSNLNFMQKQMQVFENLDYGLGIDNRIMWNIHSHIVKSRIDALPA